MHVIYPIIRLQIEIVTLQAMKAGFTRKLVFTQYYPNSTKAKMYVCVKYLTQNELGEFSIAYVIHIINNTYFWGLV